MRSSMITHLGAYPSLAIGHCSIVTSMTSARYWSSRWSTRAAALSLYKELLSAVEGQSVMLEEYARQMIYAEELHADEVTRCSASPARSAPPDSGPSRFNGLD
jgi:bacterioferritin